MGGAPDFVFLHGGRQGGWVWAQTIAALKAPAKDLRALALDVPGCGAKRNRETTSLSMEDVVDELAGDIHAAGMGGGVLVAHSQGGQVASLLLAARPALVRRVVYLACSLPLAGQSVLAMVGAGVHGAREDEVGWPLDPGTTTPAEQARTMFCNDMDEGLAAAFLSKLGQDVWPASTYAFTAWRHGAQGGAPASFVTCLRDAILPLAWQDVFAERFGAERRIRLDAGHQAMLTHPDALAAILLQEAAEPSNPSHAA